MLPGPPTAARKSNCAEAFALKFVRVSSLVVSRIAWCSWKVASLNFILKFHLSTSDWFLDMPGEKAHWMAS